MSQCVTICRRWKRVRSQAWAPIQRPATIFVALLALGIWGSGCGSSPGTAPTARSEYWRGVVADFNGNRGTVLVELTGELGEAHGVWSIALDVEKPTNLTGVMREHRLPDAAEGIRTFRFGCNAQTSGVLNVGFLREKMLGKYIVGDCPGLTGGEIRFDSY